MLDNKYRELYRIVIFCLDTAGIQIKKLNDDPQGTPQGFDTATGRRHVPGRRSRKGGARRSTVARWPLLPTLWQRQRSVEDQAQVYDAPLSGLPEPTHVLGQDGNGHARLEPQISRVGRRHRPLYDEHQGHILHAAARKPLSSCCIVCARHSKPRPGFSPVPLKGTKPIWAGRARPCRRPNARRSRGAGPSARRRLSAPGVARPRPSRPASSSRPRRRPFKASSRGRPVRTPRSTPTMPQPARGCHSSTKLSIIRSAHTFGVWRIPTGSSPFGLRASEGTTASITRCRPSTLTATSPNSPGGTMFAMPRNCLKSRLSGESYIHRRLGEMIGPLMSIHSGTGVHHIP